MAVKMIADLAAHYGVVAANDALVIHDESSSETHKIYVACLMGQVFRPEQFGAAGDGVTDDTDAMQDALDSANMAGGGIIMLSQATYLVSSTLLIYSNTSILGVGILSIIVSTTADLHVINTTTTSPSNIALDNFKIEAAGNISTTNASCIVMRNATNFRVTRMYLSNTYEDGLYIYDSTNGFVDDIYCDDTRRQGIALVSGSYISINHVRGEGTMLHLVDVEPNTGETVHHVSISDVHYENSSQPALLISGTDNDSVYDINVDDIISTTCNINHVKNGNFSNFNLKGRSDISTSEIYRVNESNFVNYQCLGTDNKIKMYVSTCDHTSFDNVMLKASATTALAFDLLANNECKFRNMSITGNPVIGVRLRNSHGTEINGISLEVDGTNVVFLINPTTSSTRTAIRGINLSYSSTKATYGLDIDGDAGDVYLDGDMSGATTPVEKHSEFTGALHYGTLIGVTRRTIPSTSNPTQLCDAGDWWRNTSPSAGGSPGSVCVQRLDTAVKTTVSSGTDLDVNIDTANLEAGDSIGITLDNNDIKWATISSITDSDTVVISSAFTSQATAGNAVYTMRWKAMASLAA